jgi:hypothetical protein
VEWEGFVEKKFRIIGVVSQYIPIAETCQNRALNFTNLQLYNSGYSVAVPMDMVLELVN